MIKFQWEVQQLIGNEWENVWLIDDQPHQFHSKEEAQQELDEHFEDLDDSEIEYDKSDYRIVKL